MVSFEAHSASMEKTWEEQILYSTMSSSPGSTEKKHSSLVAKAEIKLQVDKTLCYLFIWLLAVSQLEGGSGEKLAGLDSTRYSISWKAGWAFSLSTGAYGNMEWAREETTGSPLKCTHVPFPGHFFPNLFSVPRASLAHVWSLVSFELLVICFHHLYLWCPSKFQALTGKFHLEILRIPENKEGGRGRELKNFLLASGQDCNQDLQTTRQRACLPWHIRTHSGF